MPEIKELSALDIHYLLPTFKTLIDGKVDSIYQKENNLYLIFHKTGIGKKIMKIMLPNFIYLTDYKEEMPQTPASFCIRLRKNLKNSRLREIEQIDFERIIKLKLDCKGQTFHLIIELFHPGNIILCNNDLKIIFPFKSQRWKDRLIKGGQMYIYPRKEVNILNIPQDALKQLLDNTKMSSIVTFLAREVGFGGKYAEEICKKAKIDKNTKPKDVNAGILYKNIQTIINTKHHNINAQLDKLLTEKTITQEKEETEKEYKEKKSKVEKILDSQNEAIKKLKLRMYDNNVKGDLIYNNYAFIKSIITELNQLRRKHPWKEIKSKLQGHKVIKSIEEKKGKITLEL